MESIKRLIFPSILAGSLFIIILSGMLIKPEIVLASDGGNNPPQASIESERQSFLDIFTTTSDAQAINFSTNSGGAQISAPSISLEGCSLAPSVPEAVMRYCRAIQSSGLRTGLDVNLIAAVIFQESRGDPNAYSPSGAVGLMQVMPRDGLSAYFMCVNGPCFSERPTSDELLDPEFNIDYGTKILAGLLQKNGNLRDALKAYGPISDDYHYADEVVSIYQNFR